MTNVKGLEAIKGYKEDKGACIDCEVRIAEKPAAVATVAEASPLPSSCHLARRHSLQSATVK